MNAPTRIEDLIAERNLFKGKYRALLKLISRTRDKLVHVTDHIEDEGDRRYFGSTNDADALRDLYDEMMSWVWDAVDKVNRTQSDPYADIRKQRARADAAEAENERLRADAKLLDTIQHESWDLRCFNIPTGGDDFDIGWSVIGHWQTEPHERVVAEVYIDDPRTAIRAALKSIGGAE